MKQLILDDELLDNEEKTFIAQRIKAFASAVQDERSAAKLLIRLAERSVRIPHHDFTQLTHALAGWRRYCCLDSNK